MSQLLGRVRDKLSGSQTDTDPHRWRLRPASSYTPAKPRPGKKQTTRQTLIPHPAVFKNAFIPPDPEAGLAPPAPNGLKHTDGPIYPDVSHAALHLALLECFYGFRHSADALDFESLKTHTRVRQPPTYTEKLESLDSGVSGSTRGLEQRPAAAGADNGGTDDELRTSQKWDLLARLAVDRFGVWWRDIAKVLKHASAYTQLRHPKAVVQLGENYLPPLDVLLVWYVFILHGDGDAYASACRDHRDVPGVQKLCFPWEALRHVININAHVPGHHQHAHSTQVPSSAALAALYGDASTRPAPLTTGFSYDLPKAAQSLFLTLSSQDSDVATYLKKPPPYVEDHSFADFDGIDLYQEVRKLFGTGGPGPSSSSTQVGFVDEAHDLLWIRSPSLVRTLDRNSKEYFEKLLSGELDSSGTRSCSEDEDDVGLSRRPAFGIELLWRTHRLFPLQYRLFYEAKRGQLASGRQLMPIDDPPLVGGFDGGIEEPDTIEDLSTAVSTTSSLASKKPVCLCWTCERIRDDAPEFAYYMAAQSRSSSSWSVAPELSHCTSPSSSSSLSSSDEQSSSSLPGAPAAAGGDYDPAHIQGLTNEQLRQIQDDIGFYRAVEEKRRAREPLPTRGLTAVEKEAEKKAKENRYIPGF